MTPPFTAMTEVSHLKTVQLLVFEICIKILESADRTTLAGHSLCSM